MTKEQREILIRKLKRTRREMIDRNADEDEIRKIKKIIKKLKGET